MRTAAALVALLALAACQMEGDAVTGPTSPPPAGVELDPPLLRLVYDDGRTCDVTVPADLVVQRGWMGEAPQCAGVDAIEISLLTPGDPVILRMADTTGYLTTRGIPDTWDVTVWIAYGEGIWAQY